MTVTSHFKMSRNGKCGCLACFKQVRSDVLKIHCKTKYGTSDDQMNAMENHSYKYCKKHFSRSINCHYYQRNFKPRKPVAVSYRHGFQFGTDKERHGDFEEIQQDFHHTLVIYKINLQMTATWIAFK